MSTNYEVISVDSDHIVGMWYPLAFAIWRHLTTAQAVQQMKDAIQLAAKQTSRGIGLVQVVEESATMPDSAGRQALGDMLKSSADFIKCSVVIHEGAGFKAAAVRGIVSSLTVIAKPPFPHKIFATVEEAAAWHVNEVRAQLKATVQPAQYREVITALRSEIPTSPAQRTA